MSANEGSGNPNGTSSYFNNGSAEGTGAGFFDHNQTPVNQWGFSPPDQNSAPGGFPQTSQQHHHQQYQQPQQAPQFYNPTEFQKTPAGQEIFNPYSGGNSYQSHQPFPQDGFQQQPNDNNQQPNDYNQQQFDQNDHGESIPQQQQNPEADQGQVPYQHSWQGYGAPADGHSAPGSQVEGQDGHWQNQDNHTGQQANDSHPPDPYAHPGYGYEADMSASSNNHQEIGHSDNLTQKLEQDDMAGNSGFGAFFNNDGSDFVISSDKGSAEPSTNVSERTSPDASAYDPNSQSQTNKHVELQESAKSEIDQTNSTIEPFQPSPKSSGHITMSGYDQASERNLAEGGEMQDRTAELSLSNQDSQNAAPLSSNFGSSNDLGCATNATSDYSSFEGPQSEPFVANQTMDESNVHVPNLDMGSVESEPSRAISLVSDPSEMPLGSDGAEVVHQLLSVPVSSVAPQSSQQDSESFVKPLQPPVSQQESWSSLRSDSDKLPNRVDGPENAALATNSGPPSTQDPNVSQTDTIPSTQPIPQHHQQPLMNPNQADLTPPSNPPSLSTQSSLDTNKSSEPEDSGKKRSDSLSSGSHPSAFRQVRGHHGHRDISVNPSPPLWQTEVPALPGNILLAPALNISTTVNPLVPTNMLSSPSLSTPRQLADSVASVSVPPVSSLAASLLSGTNNAPPQVGIGNQPSATTSAPTAVQQVTQSVSQLNICKTVPNTSVVTPMSIVPSVQVSQQQQQMPITNPNPVAYVQPVGLSQPNPVHPTTPQQNVAQPQINPAHPATSMHGIQPSNPTVPTQGFGVASTPQQQPQPFSGNVPNQQQPNNMNNPPHMQQQDVIAGQQGVTATQPQQPFQQDYQQQQQNPQQQQLPQGPQSQQPGYNQYPSGQQGGQWYPNPANRQQPYPQGYYQGGGYGQGYRGYGYGSPYARQGPYSRQDQYYQQGYGQQMPRTPQRSAAEGQQWERPQSRAGSERPGSRQGWPDEQQDYDARYQRSRRDPRYYGGVDEYGRPYDRRYYEYYRRKQQQQQSGQGYRDREYQKYYEQQRNRSGSQQNSQDASSLTASDVSLTEKKDSSQNESFSEEFHHQGGGTPEHYGTNQSAIYPSGYENQDPRWRRDQSYYDNMNASDRATYDGSQYYNQDNSWQQEEQQTSVTPPPPERRTPVKHPLPHVIARFSPGGQLIKVLPNVPSDGMPALVEVHNVEMMMENCDEITEYKAYPGPLIKGETHKNDVLHFAATQATECRKSTDLSDKESAALLWDLLVLLCRQNGTVVETDISDLLLKDHPMTSRESTLQQEGEEEGEAAQEGADISDLLPELPKSTDPLDMVKQTHRFRELLLFGRKKEALEWAMKKCLWGHALLLASKMDNRTHASVMTRFANSLPMNDPLQTLYQLMSDRQPAAVTSCNDEKWGDWRPHLAMVMSNLSSSADVGFKSVVTLGDSLSSRGLLHASQFCYLMAQIGFGIYSKKTTKIVLLGSSHNLPFNNFSTNSAIQLTEIYEYAQMLANKHFLIPNFQAYKFIYACRLADFGFTSQALRYCETIANTIQCSANYYNSTLVSQVCQLSHRLKHHDPEFHDMREITEPQWIVPLENILLQINEGQLKPPSSSGTPMPWVESSSNLSTLGVESTDGTVQAMGEGVSAYQYDGQGGYQQDQQVGGQGYEGQDDQQQEKQYQDQLTVQQQQEGPFYDYNQQQQLQQPQQQDGSQPTSQQQHQQQYYQYGNSQPYNNQPVSSNFPPNQDLGASLRSNFSEYSTTTNPSETEGESTEFEQSGASQFDFNSYNQMQQQQQQQSRSRTNTLSSMAGPPSPQKTLTPPDSPNSFTASRHRTRTTSGGSTASAASQRGGHQQQKPEPKETKPQNKPKPKSSQGGWLRWFNKKLGGSNIHLPDDTKKTIEWDPVKKQWINKAEDAEETDNGPPPPPPSDREISGSAPPSSAPAMQPPGSTPGLGGGLGSAAAPPPMGANKFSRKFGAGNYVDVLNQGKGTSSLAKTGGDTSSLFQTLPAPANAVPVNFFIPDSSASEDTQTSNQEGDPQVGNPGSRPHSPHHEQEAGQQSENLSRSSSMSDLSSEVSQHMAHQPTAQPPPSWQQEAGNASQQHQHQPQQQQQHQPQQQQTQQPPQQPAQPAGVPMFYNPQQFTNPAGAAVAPTGFGQGGGSAAGSAAGAQAKRGYGQPRQYPTQR